MITMNRETFEMFDEAMRVMRNVRDMLVGVCEHEYGVELDACDLNYTWLDDKYPKILSVANESADMLDAWDVFKKREAASKIDFVKHKDDEPLKSHGAITEIFEPSDSLIASLEAAKASGHITGDGAVVMDFVAQPPEEAE